MAKKNQETNNSNPLQVGNSVLVRTVTHYYTGRIREFNAESILLEDAAWIADTGRWSQALETGALSEVEPFLDAVLVFRGAGVDVTHWKHPLPREVK